jgi:hypothetical protein
MKLIAELPVFRPTCCRGAIFLPGSHKPPQIVFCHNIATFASNFLFLVRRIVGRNRISCCFSGKHYFRRMKIAFAKATRYYSTKFG